MNFKTDADDAPPFSRLLLDVLSCARSGWAPRLLFVGWIAAMAAHALDATLLHEVPEPGSTALLVVVLLVLGIPAGGMIAGSAGWEFGREYRWTLRESLSMLGRRAPVLYLSVLGIPLVVVLLFLIAAAGAFVLGLIPSAVGDTLVVLWLLIIGVPLGVVAAGLLVLGLPALLLIVPAAALDCRESIDAVSRAMGYVRSRPLKFSLAALVAALTALLSAAVCALFAVFLGGFLLLASVHPGLDNGHAGIHGRRGEVDPAELRLVESAAPEVESQEGQKGPPDGVLRQFSGDLAALFLSADILWPFWSTGKLPPEGTANTGLSILGMALARLVTASFFAALLAGLSRLYLHLRWDLDRETPASLIRVNERFEWAGEREPRQGGNENAR